MGKLPGLLLDRILSLGLSSGIGAGTLGMLGGGWSGGSGVGMQGVGFRTDTGENLGTRRVPKLLREPRIQVHTVTMPPLRLGTSQL